MTPFLTRPELAREIASRPGLIPVQIDCEASRILWMDLQDYHCYHGFFAEALAWYQAICPAPPAAFLSDCDALLAIEPRTDCIAPSGFIFHAGRCGSTLLARVLARSRAHLVLGEAAPHNQIWKVADLSRSPVELYRRLVLAMGRRRSAACHAHFIKFTSFNIIQFGAIRAAFPDTPAIFLFREPGPLLGSWHRGPPIWMEEDPGIGKSWTTPECAVEDFFRAAIAIREPGFRCLDYADLTPSLLPDILRFFRVQVSGSDLRQMTHEFSLDAKSAYPQPFERAAGNPVTVVSGQLVALYKQLRERAAGAW